ncbi:MAG: hypothetical protein J5J06_10240, partial [Phycisphaerae bacterium]|nr:hypothetical protein [Phycisphaerae bacterium]
MMYANKILLQEEETRRTEDSDSVLVKIDACISHQPLMPHHLPDAGVRHSRLFRHALHQSIKCCRVVVIIVPIEVEVEDSAFGGGRAGAGNAHGTLVGGVHVAVGVAVAPGGGLVDGE